MTEFKLNWSEKAIKEYVMAQIFGTRTTTIIIIALYAACFCAVPIVGIVSYFMTKQIFILILSLVCLAVGVLLALTLILVINKSTEKTHKNLSESAGLICAVSDKDILLIKDNLPYGVIEWSSIADISETKSAYFLMTKSNLLLVLEKDAVYSGVISEAEEILKIKSGALENNA